MNQIESLAAEVRATIAETKARLADSAYHFGNGGGARYRERLAELADRCKATGLWAMGNMLTDLAGDVHRCSGSGR